MAEQDLVTSALEAVKRVEQGGDPREMIASLRLLVQQHTAAKVDDHPERSMGTARNALVLDICKIVSRFVDGELDGEGKRIWKVDLPYLRGYLLHMQESNPRMMRLPRMMLDQLTSIITPATTREDLRPFTQPPKVSMDEDTKEPIIEPRSGGPQWRGVGTMVAL